MRDPELEQAASEHYNPDLPYHNFGHALASALTGLEIVEDCRRENIPIDQDVVYCALLFHDAGYHQDHAKMGFATKEAFSAHIARTVLEKQSQPPEYIERVEKAILSTIRDASCMTTEDNAVRAADLSKLAADYSVFRHNTELLKQEYEFLFGQPVTWEEWKQRSTNIIELFLRQEFRLTHYYSGQPGHSPFHKKVKHNLLQLNTEPVTT